MTLMVCHSVINKTLNDGDDKMRLNDDSKTRNDLRTLRVNQLKKDNFIDGSHADERIEIVAWMLENDFDTWVEVELKHNAVKNKTKKEREELARRILRKSFKALDRVFYGNKADRDDWRTPRISFLHLGKKGTNPHFHAFIKSDSRVSEKRYRDLLTMYLRRMFDETSDGCVAQALKKDLECGARYATHEYEQLGNDTIDVDNAHTKQNSDDRYDADVERRVERLEHTLLKKLTRAQKLSAKRATRYEQKRQKYLKRLVKRADKRRKHEQKTKATYSTRDVERLRRKPSRVKHYTEAEKEAFLENARG